MAERGDESKERVSMELSDEVLKAMEVGLAFRDYVSAQGHGSLHILEKFVYRSMWTRDTNAFDPYLEPECCMLGQYRYGATNDKVDPRFTHVSDRFIRIVILGSRFIEA